jgi:hypothetical protein
VRRTPATLLAVGLVCGALVAVAAPVTAGEVTASGTVYAGIYTTQWDGNVELDALASISGKRVTFGGTFHDVLESESPFWSGNTAHKLEGAWLGQSTPLANLTINATAAAIASGAHDAAIATWARRVEAWLGTGGGRSVIIAPLQEMNGTWTPYGCDAANFKTAYRKIVDTVRGLGMDETKVRFAFAPNGWTSPGCGTIADYHPGTGYVDVVAFSAYNFGTCVPPSTVWTAYYATIGGVADDLRAQGFGSYPFIVAQTGAPAPSGCGGDQDAWIRDLFTYTASDANIVGFVYFNIDKANDGETDWRVWNGASATSGWRDGMAMATTKHVWPLTDWFRPGPIPFAGAAPGAGPCPAGKTCDTVAFVDTGGQWKRWNEVRVGSGVNTYFFGNPGDVAFQGDWDCDGDATPGLYRQSDGFVYLRNSNTQGVADLEFFFGDPGDYPLIGDFDGDGCDTVSIYRGSEGKIYVINRLGEDGGGLGAADYSFFFGNPGDGPFVGDFDGDGIDTVGLYRVSTGFVYFRNSLSTGVADLDFFYGDPGDQIMAGDWDGDGDDTVAVYRPSDGRLYVNLENAPGAADHTLTVGSYRFAVTSRSD